MKKPDINVAELLKKLSFLKNNLGLLVPIIIVVVGLLLFIPTRILSGQLRSTVNDNSVKMSQQISSLTRTLGELSPSEGADEEITTLAADVNQIDAILAETVYRELLDYYVFSGVTDVSAGLFERFGKEYCRGVDEMLAEMGAGRRPDDAELTAALQSATQNDRDARRGSRAARVPGGTQVWSLLMMSDVEQRIFNEVCAGAARTAKVYAGPAEMAGYAYWDSWTFTDVNESFKDCWYWQLGYWVLQDVADTIEVMNRDSDNILDAPVKRIMSVSFVLKQGAGALSVGGSRAGKAGDRPSYVTSQTDGLTQVCTGRLTDKAKNIDVLHFQVQVVIDSTQVLPFICELCRAKEHHFYGFDGSQPEQTFQHNQITVLETAMTPVEPLAVEHQAYAYGPSPTTVLNLICEYVLPRPLAYEEIKPEPVKKEFAEKTDNYGM